MQNIIIIPAFNPDEKLVALVEELTDKKIADRIIVVNDGSKPDCSGFFKDIKSKVVLLTHEVNKGKGASIKTALGYIKENVSEECGIVTVDADGQHRPEDAKKLLESLSGFPHSLVLGVRTFSEDIPWKSRWGNKITRFVFHVLSGANVSDTQTGLRAFKSDLVQFLLEVSGDRYEYEMNMLASCARNKIKINEVPIATIYIDQVNSTSHFRVIRDSLRIYGSLLLYAGSSFISFLFDFLLFNIFLIITSNFLISEESLILSNVVARILSSMLNYYLNSTYVFRTPKKFTNALSYFLLAGGILAVNTFVLSLISVKIGISEPIAKLITEIIMFCVSYFVQKYIIFNPKIFRKKV